MNPISNLWRQLVQRRLWPVAVLLVAALAAVPLMLAQDPKPEPAPVPQAATEDASSELATTPIVAKATPVDRAKRRKVLGKAKNPFAKPAKLGGSAQSGPKAAQLANDAADKAGSGGPTKLADNLTIVGGGGSLPPTPSGPPLGTPVAPTVPEPKPAPKERHSITVRFGGDEALERMNVKVLEALPLAEEPLVAYDGVTDGGRTAVFLVDSSVEAQGDGDCVPDPNTCEKIHLSEGETEFFDVLDANGESIGQYQLDLIEIHGGKKSSSGRTASAKAAGPGSLQDRAEKSGVARTAEVGLALP